MNGGWDDSQPHRGGFHPTSAPVPDGALLALQRPCAALGTGGRLKLKASVVGGDFEWETHDFIGSFGGQTWGPQSLDGE